jgi:outer membrane murein-binding lipoprotein Lpp
MGIFGFLSKAHIEQTSAGEESVAQVTQIESEVGRLNAIIERAEGKIKALETSGTGSDANLQSQIDKEQDRIDKAYERIKPAIEQQNKIITDARGTDANRTKPYEDQLTSITAEILRLETSAKEYEAKIENLDSDSSGVEPLLAQIDALEKEIIRVTNQLQSTEKGEIRAGQAIIGVSSDGLFGGNTRTALAKWVQGQRDRITQIQGEVAQVRKDATSQVDAERVRLAGVVKDIREVQIPALKERELVMLGKIDEVRQTESPVIQTARDEIQRLRESAEAQVVNSQALIERLRSQLAQTDKADEIDAAVDEQMLRIKNANNEIDTLTETKYSLQAEYRKLEAEVGPIKYIAEFVYGEQADNTMLEEAVRWVILIIIFVFDPLAVLLLIASQYTFEWRNTRKDDNGERLRQYEQARAQRIVDNVPPNYDVPTPPEEEEVEEPKFEDVDQETLDKEFDDEFGDIEELQKEQPKKKVESSDVSKQRELELEEQEEDLDWKDAKQRWKDDHPQSTIKNYKNMYIRGVINKLPWETYLTKPDTIDSPSQEGYIQNEEQSNESIWKRIGDK